MVYQSHIFINDLVAAESNSICLLKDGQLHGGEHEGVDVFTVCRSVQRGFRGAAVDFGQRMLQQLNGGQDLWEKRPLVLGLIDTVSQQSLHGFRTTLIELTEVWRQISPTDHVNDLNKTVNKRLKKAQGTTVNTCN